MPVSTDVRCPGRALNKFASAPAEPKEGGGCELTSNFLRPPNRHPPPSTKHGRSQEKEQTSIGATDGAASSREFLQSIRVGDEGRKGRKGQTGGEGRMVELKQELGVFFDGFSSCSVSSKMTRGAL